MSLRLNYSFICSILHTGNTLVYNNTEGMIYSPHLMNKLLIRNQTYTYHIEADFGMKIYLAFSYMNLGSDVQCSRTSLSIYEGTNTSESPKEIRCGRNSTEFLSSTNILTLKYINTNEPSVLSADHGFIIYYSSNKEGESLLTSSIK